MQNKIMKTGSRSPDVAASSKSHDEVRMFTGILCVSFLRNLIVTGRENSHT